ncbi:hypothetical protein M513_09280 [Trichuris suis]|uniref:Uncharacterized protein n=1 Tax=Trichuris suis TaxID=68888 RepID=A0A085LXW7_9BILA|nr:hypothetical protein M513_09280 [Trichuris suis]
MCVCVCRSLSAYPRSPLERIPRGYGGLAVHAWEVKKTPVPRLLKCHLPDEARQITEWFESNYVRAWEVKKTPTQRCRGQSTGFLSACAVEHV